MNRPNVVVIANPCAGPSWRRRSPRALAARIEALLGRHHAEGQVRLTDGPGHAHALAREALQAGAGIVVAWGGDGTINEVASALMRGPASLGIVPVGSGNGLGREVGVPSGHEAALQTALAGRDRMIDAGELNGRAFFNTAGIGFDGHVIGVFASATWHVRGLPSYAAVALREFFRYRPSAYVIREEGRPDQVRGALLISVANTRQWGNGAIIAPAALMDDERLDLVIVPPLPPAIVLANMWRLFSGSLAGWPTVETRQVRAATILASPPAPVQVDGEPVGDLDRIEIRVIPAALRVRAPRLSRPRV